MTILAPSWGEAQKWFHVDGTLRDIYVLDTSTSELKQLFTALQDWGYKIEYFEDGERRAVPASFEEVYSRAISVAVLLTLKVRSMALHWHFFSDDELELDLDPKDVRDQSDLDALLDFMRRLAKQLSKPVLLTPENEPTAPFISCGSN